MKRADVQLKAGDRVLVATGGPRDETLDAFVAGENGLHAELQFNDGQRLLFKMDGTRSGLAVFCDDKVTHVNGEAVEGAPTYTDRRGMVEALNNTTRAILLCDSMAAALREFCDRVDADEIRSKRTYAQFKALLAEYEALS